MITNTAAYWIAVGVLALGLNSEYQHGRFVTLHRVADRASSVWCQLSVRAEESLAVTTGLTNRRASLRESVLVAADQAEMAQEQAQMIREEARAQAELVPEQVREQILAQRDVLRAQAQMRRAEIEQLRWRVRSDLRLTNANSRRVAVLCPKMGARVMVSEGMQVVEDSPDVEVVDTP
jgi:hypothetical protein